MKSDIVRAWKDETYRQSLSDEQFNALPANPAGDLSEVEMAAVSGGEGWDNVGLFGASSSSSSATYASVRRCHTYAFLCDTSVFSANVLGGHKCGGGIWLGDVINVLTPNTQTCANSH
jgi:mersacidin/lichenicidin family type 2 lantibiotic